MARKSDGEKIDEFMVLLATLNERLDNVREDLQELRHDWKDARHRLWLIVPPVVAALVSAGLTALVSYLVRH